MDKEFQADVMRVQDEQRQRDMIETRKMEELQSLKAQAQAGKQMQASAITDFASLAVSAGTGQEMAQAEAGKTDPSVTRAAKAAARRGATAQQIKSTYDTGGQMGLKQLNIGTENTGFLGGGTKVGGFFRDIGQTIGGFFNF
jgi:Zn/Cd-binding protein ZinT